MNQQDILLMTKNGCLSAYYGDLVNARVRTRYSLSEELSLLRRRDEAPEAFHAYSAFVEECKAAVAAEIGGCAP